MANVSVFLSDLQTGRSVATVHVRLLRFWEPRNVRHDGELMGVDMLLLDSQRHELLHQFEHFVNQVLAYAHQSYNSQYQVSELKKQPSSSKRRLQFLAKKHEVARHSNVFGNGEASIEAHNHKECVLKKMNWCLHHSSNMSVTAEKVLMRYKQSCGGPGGYVAEEKFTSRKIYEWLTKPVRKCLTEIF